MNIPGLHHVTAIASDPQRNLDFYTEILGLRLAKKTVNFDDPGSYHFYFGDEVGSPGTILTFFPWPHARRGARGSGETESTAFTIPATSIDHWTHRLSSFGVTADRTASRFGEDLLRFSDPDGMLVELVAANQPVNTAPYEGAVPAEHAIRGFHSISLALDFIEGTANLLTGLFSYRRTGEQGNRVRFTSAVPGAAGTIIDLIETPDAQHGRPGAGSVHHVAFRATDPENQLRIRSALVAAGFGVSPVMERVYFQSIYFREPGGVLFEIATDGPGFTVDEPRDVLGEHLQLPPWLESSRERIEEILPSVKIPEVTRS